MNKKNLRFYEAPVCDIVELKASVALLAGSTAPDGGESGPGETPGVDDMEEL